MRRLLLASGFLCLTWGFADGCGGSGGSSPMTPTPPPIDSASCIGNSNFDALGGIPFILSVDPISYGCRIANSADGHPVHDGSQSVRFELHATDCNASAAVPDCLTDRSRYVIIQDNGGTSTDGKILSYEYWVYVPVQARFRPKGGNLLFLDAIQAEPLTEGAGATIALVEVGQDNELMVRADFGFDQQSFVHYPLVPNPIGTWTKIAWEIKSTTQSDGYIRVFANDVLMADYQRATLQTAGWRNRLRIGIYNAFKSKATEPYDTQVVYFDGLKASVR